MRLLLDTNALIWWLQDDAKLGPKSRALIAGGNLEVLVSIVSCWEVTMKWRAGKMGFSGTYLLDQLSGDDLTLVNIKQEHLLALETLEMHHKDPFDHLILAQAKVEGAAIITSDREMSLYGVKCFPASR